MPHVETLYNVQWVLPQPWEKMSPKDRAWYGLKRELLMIRKGGRFKTKAGRTSGNGLAWHFKRACQHVWPRVDWHRWNELILKEWLAHKYVGIMGPKSSGKTFSIAMFHLIDYYAWPNETTVLVCSTEMERLQERIWGDIVKLHGQARANYDFLPGHVIESKHRITTDQRSINGEGRDFRMGLTAVPCKKGGSYVGLGSFVGIKNKRVRLIGDELQLLPMVFLDAIHSLSAPGCDFKVTGMGNPNEPTNAHGKLCEPAADLGGWDSNIDQSPKTKTWRTRWPGGVCIQLPGSDSPNNDYQEDQPIRFPYLINREILKQDAAIYGVDDWHYTMFNEGRMPRGQGSHRVITRNMCIQHGALRAPIWRSSKRKKIACLDAAYRGVGGDRCVFMVLEFGESGEGTDLPLAPVESTISRIPDSSKAGTIIALTRTSIVPITGSSANLGGLAKFATQEEAEDQIVAYVMKACREEEIPPEDFFYDSGMRTGLVQAFSRIWSANVNSIDCGGKPSDNMVSRSIQTKACDYYDRKITELWFSVRLTVEAGQWRGLTEDVIDEGSKREWITTGGNKISLETKKDMKEKVGRSPDLFDDLAIGLEGAKQRGFATAEKLNFDLESHDYRWKEDFRGRAAKLWTAGQLRF